MRELPASLGALTGLQTLNVTFCKGLTALPASLGAITGLQTLNLLGCKGLTALPAWLGALTGLQTLDLYGCSALHTPPPPVVAAGTSAVLQYLRDLAKGQEQEDKENLKLNEAEKASAKFFVFLATS